MARAKDYQNKNPLQQLANDTWGGGDDTDEDAINALKAVKKEHIKPINIFEVVPDYLQPRRAVPSAVRQAWGFNVSEDGMLSLFDHWIAASSNEAVIEYETMKQTIVLRVMGGDSDEDEEELPVGDIGSGLIALASLAGNIRHHGLTNPISVYKTKSGYQIETGERRWLAYHLLWLMDVETDWSKISARVMESFNVWRQAGENTVRSDLNAISKARQFSLLMMDLYSSPDEEGKAKTFKPIEAFEHEQDYYAQVADGNEYRVPRGKGEELVGAMGLKNTRQLRDYRRLLRISKDLWVAADDGNWTEFKLRRILEDTEDTDSVPTGTVYGDAGAVDRSVEVITRDDVFRQATRLNVNYESERDELKALSDVLAVVRKRIKYLKAQGDE